ncbi:MAG: sulfite exporter TauE/SafE family protein [Pirellulaceae bacterium]|nr:sulfite exporter TauE/SafE family protein [Pirellulaceae bacterium]
MWILIGAVVTASVLGSMHCVGMCGPLALWASGAGDGNSRLALNTSLYHFGRMLTYALVGLLAGLVGQLTDFGGEVLGVQLAAARIVGVIMVVMGVIQVLKWWSLRQDSSSWFTSKPSLMKPSLMKPSVTPKQSLVSKWLVSLRPRVFALNPPSRALATGLLTALLPCGWLYLFALFAAGTGSWLSGSVVMVAFWLGSVPALVAVVMSTKLLTGRLRQFVPVVVALMMIIAGGFTMAGRGFANLHSLAEIPVPKQQGTEDTFTTSLDELVKTPLPCCQTKDK